LGKVLKLNEAKRKFGRKSLFFVNIILVMVPVTYFGYEPLLRYSASLIVIDSQPRKADAIVLLAGGEPGRAWGAADLYREEWAPYVVLTREFLSPDELELQEHGIEVGNGFTNSIRILRGMGVPEDAIVQVEPSVEYTSDELNRVRELAEQRHWKSLMIVTSNYHTRRARLSARYIFRSNIDFHVVGSRHGGINRYAWWKTRTDQRTFLIEFEKLVAYTLYIWPQLVF
jgi:uncharacterized SAM-binding protein YcdF (DUF218 family)